MYHDNGFTFNNIYFRNIDFINRPDVMYVNRVSLPENYSRYTFIALYRFFRDISFVAVDQKAKRVIGYILNKEDRGKSFFTDKVVKKGHVFSIAVLPEYRRRRIGETLLSLGMNAMFKNGANEIYLEVRVSNKPAIELYKKFGMKIVGVIKSYYSDGEDANIMAANKETSEKIIKEILTTLRGGLNEQEKDSNYRL